MGIGVSIFLMAVGAIFAFAINVSAEGIDLDTLGVILIILGLVGLLASLVWWNDWTPNRRTVAYDDAGDRVIVRHRGPRQRPLTRRARADGEFVEVPSGRRERTTTAPSRRSGGPKPPPRTRGN